jgi:hypothetical protein
MDAQDSRLTEEATALTCRARRTSAAGRGESTPTVVPVRQCQRKVNRRSSPRYLGESGIRPLRTTKEEGKEGAHSLPLSTYTA